MPACQFLSRLTGKYIENKITAQQTASSLCYAYLNELKSILKVDFPEEQFVIRSESTDRLSKTHFRLDQVYKGVPVYGRML